MLRSVVPRLHRPLPAMAQLDSHAWVTGLAFRAYCVTIGIRADSPDGVGALWAALPFGWEPYEEEGVDHLYSVILSGAPDAMDQGHLVAYGDAERVVRSRSLESLAEGLQSNIRLFVAEHTREKVFVHLVIE